MKLSVVGFVICQIFMLSLLEISIRADSSRYQENDEDEILTAEESRYHLKDPYPEYVNRDYRRKDEDLSVTFQAPRYDANDYWNYKNEEDNYDNRRTFFEGDRFPQSDKQTTFSGIYRFMTSLFSGESEGTATPEPFYHNHPTHPYPFENPRFNFRPRDSNYVPQPKPIRASVIKLETIPRDIHPIPPIYQETTTKYSPYLGRILNHVLIENSKNRHHQDLSFHYQHSSDPPHVLPKPNYITPTTLRPIFEYNNFFDNRTIEHRPLKRYNATGHKYPNSVQDQLPHLDHENVKIPYVVEETDTTTTFQPFPLLSDLRYFPHNRNPFLKRNLTSLIDIRSLDWTADNTTKERPGTARITYLRTTIPHRPIKITTTNRVPVELITNLTVEGLSKRQNDTANIQNYVNYFNMGNLINYKMKQLNVSETKTTILESFTFSDNNSSSHPVNLNDELSLDAKILKDTNWDGFSTTELIPPLVDVKTVKRKNPPEVRETTVKYVETTHPFWFTTVKIAKEFYETEEKTINPIFDTKTTEIAETTTTLSEILTTTEGSLIEATTESKYENDITTTFTTRQQSRKFNQTAKRRLDVLQLETTRETVVPEVIETTTEIIERPTTLVFIPRRKYNRRPKVLNFTPYPNEPRKLSLNRNNFPKRQKPNITLAFGNKNIIKNRENYGREELIKFSDEDLGKRKRRIGKRRNLFKRTRTSTEKPIQEYTN